MIKLKDIITERIDFHQIATELVKKYKLKSKVKIGSGKNFGEYIPETDTITLRPSYSTLKEFYMTILHEIGHALDADRLGKDKFIKKYGISSYYMPLPIDNIKYLKVALKKLNFLGLNVTIPYKKRIIHNLSTCKN